MKTKHLLLPLLLMFFSFELIAQLDTKHWIPPFFAKVEDGSGTANIRDHFVALSTPAEDTIPVVIRNGFGDLIDTVYISKAMPMEYTFGPTGNATGNPATSVYPLNVIPRDSLNMPIRSQGLYFESFQPFFVNMRHKSGSQGFSLTSKGQVGLGTKFFSGHIYTINNTSEVWNDERRSHFISVMATEDNTEVTIDMIKEPITIIGQDGPQGEPITVTLDAFESYVIGVDHDSLANDVINNFNGTRITSDKPIVCNSGSWLSGNQSGQCIGADQLVTAEVTGQEYILVRGRGDETTERPMVVAVEDNTEVYLNDESAPVAILDEGEFYFIETEKYTDNDNLYILSTEKVYVFQTSSGQGINSDGDDKAGPTVGLSFIPPLNCVGAKEVNLPFVNSLTGPGGSSKVNIITKAGTSIFIDDSPTPLTGAQTVVGNSEWVTYAYFPGDVPSVNIVSDSVMNVGLVIEDDNVGASGYFSGFTLEPVVGLSAGISGSTPCIPGNAVFQVFGFDTYQWYYEGEELEGFTANTLVPEFAGEYSVEGIDLACGFRFLSNPFDIPYCPSTLGAAKEVQVVQETSPGSRIFDVTYRIFIQNIAESISQNIQVIENIQNGLPVGATAELIGSPTLAFGILSGGLNPDFDGVSDRRLLPGTGDLPGVAADAIDLTVRVDMNNAEQDGYRNQVTITSIDEGVNDGISGPFNGQDFSQAGSTPDPDGDGEPNEEEENIPTLTCFFPNTFAYAAESFCISDDVQAISLDGVSSGIFTADSEGLVLDSETGNITPQESEAGTYTVTFTVEGRCPTVTTTEVTIIPIPVPGEGSMVEVCEQSEEINLSDLLDGEDAGGTWTDADGNEVGVGFTPAIPGSNVFTYTVINEPCAAESEDVTVNVIAAPVPGVPAENTTFCSDQPEVALDALIEGADAGGVWTNAGGDTLESAFEFTGEETYTLTYTVTNDICGERSTEVDLTVVPLPYAGMSVGDEMFCAGEEVNLNDLLVEEDEDGQWYDPEGQETDNVIILNELGFQTFTYIISDEPCPQDTSVVNIEVFEEVSAGEVNTDLVELCPEDPGINLFNYLDDPDGEGEWTDSDGLVVSNFFNPDEEGDFEFTYTVSSEICGDVSAVVSVNVSEDNCIVPPDPIEFEVPQGFSPNGDGINDEFIIPGLNELYPNNSLQIFNRWGAEVLSASPYNNDWDGKAKSGLNSGEPLPVATYWYILDLGNGSDPIMDFIYLNR
jgi:gliding motility-associated-like protein